MYLDLESEADRAKLSEPALYLASHGDKLVILDEVHRLPNVFQTLRGLIDRNRRRTAHRPVPATRLGFHRSPQTIWRNTGWPHSIS
ncbi:hypothetical protein N5C66_27290 [Rhizobium pusense]|uniref:AAA family ATPase n=1 Tax=Rhizobium/Agrobacterium group TaxID=227290 RepID=UPI001F23DAD6|nr:MULTISPECIES: hypothetical protein [Rhizobium/Agrobacterium group]MDH0116116.1 hypothetical protein [Agrobacterium pusense]MDH0912705.1 hypothetical protein [Agrobacterium pusense]MDH1098989.1 hypothetical protein [Agrobacterium pusense]MDH1115409.1 hypothetical protein [Agrobacterium pusense]WFN89478.1 hypothetical protein P9K39_23700 [Agrobacterium pusense]